MHVLLTHVLHYTDILVIIKCEVSLPKKVVTETLTRPRCHTVYIYSKVSCVNTPVARNFPVSV